jgi:molecular chaperone DnaJ
LSKNYYETLGVDKHAESDDIKKAYRQLSMQHHPDKGGDAEKFKELSEAYSVLSDPEKRKDYDNPMRNMGNPFEDMMRGFGGAHPFGRPQQPDPNAPRRGRNMLMEQLIPLKYFIFGGKYDLKFSFRDPCPDCAGTGAEERMTCSVCNGLGQIIEGRRGQGVFVQSARACPNCHGRGFTAKKPCEPCSGSGARTIDKDLKVNIPAGVTEGFVVGVTGEGGVGVNGAPNGDLGVKIHMQMPNPDELTDEQKRVLEEI